MTRRQPDPSEFLPVCEGPGRTLPLALCFCWTPSRRATLPHHCFHHSFGGGGRECSRGGVCLWVQVCTFTARTREPEDTLRCRSSGASTFETGSANGQAAGPCAPRVSWLGSGTQLCALQLTGPYPKTKYCSAQNSNSARLETP